MTECAAINIQTPMEQPDDELEKLAASANYLMQMVDVVDPP